MSEVYYQDKDERALKKRRRHHYLATLIMRGNILVLLSAIFLYNLVLFSPIEPTLYYLYVGLIMVLIGMGYLLSMDVKNARDVYLKGIMLTESSFIEGGKEIDLKDILRAEIIEFQGSGTFLVMGYAQKKKRGIKKRILLLGDLETSDIRILCDKIREMKGWEPQHKIRAMGPLTTYSIPSLEEEIFSMTAEKQELPPMI